jgi:SAM-dependent methyltransferase
LLTVDISRLGIEEGDLVADLGCGGGRHAFELARRGARVVAMDAGFEQVATVKTWLDAMVQSGEIPESRRGWYQVLQGDARRLPFADGSFKAIVVSEVLEHIPEDEVVMRELARVLQPGGILAVTVPRLGPELVNWILSREYHDTPGGHVRIYPRSVLVSRVMRAGFAWLGQHHAHGLHSPYWWLRCAVGVSNDEHPLVAAYHKLLVWDITDRPLVTRLASRVLDPLIGKSLVLYFERLGESRSTPAPSQGVDDPRDASGAAA